VVSGGREQVSVYDEDLDAEVPLPMCWVICGDCRGEGFRALHGFAISAEVWGDWDDEERDDYLRGRYDTACETCDGAGKVWVVDVDQFSDREAELWEAEQRFLWGDAMERKMERMMGA
jgi:hypothetical protein